MCTAATYKTKDFYFGRTLDYEFSYENESITVESMSDGLHIYDNPVGVLTNNPPFPQQMFQLNNYM